MKSPWAEDGVTFQVGMVGSDGVVLGSDRLHAQLLGTRSAFLANKIVIAEDCAYCCAGDDLGISRFAIAGSGVNVNQLGIVDVITDHALYSFGIRGPTVRCQLEDSFGSVPQFQNESESVLAGTFTWGLSSLHLPE